MEDEYVLTELPSLVDHILVGVFDGHGGSGAAKYASKHLASVLEQTDEWRRYAAVENREHYIDVLKQAMLKAFSELDDRLRHQQMNSNQASDTGGCTAVIALITPHFIVCANAGDSRCILGCGGTMIPLSNDHKPNDPEERARVIRAGGIVINNRVQNTLAVSRALGDFKYKSNQQLPPSQQMVRIPGLLHFIIVFLLLFFFFNVFLFYFYRLVVCPISWCIVDRPVMRSYCWHAMVCGM